MPGDKKNHKKRNKRGVKVFFFTKPHGQKHKNNTKNKYYVSEDKERYDHGRSSNDWSPTGSIMSSGDSPSHHNRTADVFDFRDTSSDTSKTPFVQSDAKPRPLEQSDGRSSPIATTSRGVVTGEKGHGEVQGSVLAEPGGDKDKEKDKEEEEKLFGSPTLNNSEGGGDGGKNEERRGTKEDSGDKGKDKKDRKDDKFRKNGDLDKLDGIWVPKERKNQQKEEEEGDCIVKCLYVTVTCCECTIM